MIIPLDVQVLRFALDFVTARSLGNKNLINELLDPKYTRIFKGKYTIL